LGSGASKGKLRHFAIIVAFLVYAGSPAGMQAQLAKPALHPPAASQTAASVDPLGRETPRGAVMGLLKNFTRGDYTTAARYLQPRTTRALISYSS
jgi:hypothetical protein